MRVFLLILRFFVGFVWAKEEKITPYTFREGSTGAGNFTRFLLPRSHPQRAILHSIEGDADLYFSLSNPNVTFFLEDHDRSSATCGIDYVDIPVSTEAYLSIYGHPFHAESKWRLLVVAGRNSSVSEGEFDVEPEVIYQWDRLKKASENPPEANSELQIILEICVSCFFEIVQILVAVLL